MAKLTAFIKRHWLAVVLCCVIAALVISVIVPFVINEIYKAGGGYITLWEAKDVFAFYGSYLSFLGSLSLGAVAVFQNKRANDLTTQMQKIEQARFVSMVDLEVSQHDMRCQPIDQVKQEKMPAKSPGVYMNLAADLPNITKCYIVEATIKNKSEYPIVQIGIHPGKRGEGIAQIFGMKNYHEKATYIPAQGSITLKIAIPSEFLSAAQKSELSLSIDFTNIFDYKTAATLYLENFGSMNTPFRSQYRLSKFVDVKPHSEQE